MTSWKTGVHLIQVVKATKADARQLAKLEYFLSIDSQRFEPVKLAANLKKKLEEEMIALLGDPRNCVLKAVDGKKTVGILSAGLRKHSIRYAEREYADVHALYVLPSHRRKGVARKLFRALFAWAKRRGLKELGLKTQVKNKVAIKAYHALGFRDCWLGMKKFI